LTFRFGEPVVGEVDIKLISKSPIVAMIGLVRLSLGQFTVGISLSLTATPVATIEIAGGATYTEVVTWVNE
jgi:hypothetical protein